MAPQEKDERIFAEIERGLKIFIPHITLARIRRLEWKKLPENPKIDEKVLIKVPVISIEVMESDLSGDGAEYVILESAELG